MKYAKKTARALVPFIVILGVAAGVTGCVSPFYGTARIEKGFHMDAGLAGTSYMVEDEATSNLINPGPDPGDPHYMGIRGDIGFRYGFNDYIQGCVRTGLGWGFNGKIYWDTTTAVDDHLLFDAALGAQFAVPFLIGNKFQLTPALRAEAAYGYGRFYGIPTFMLGLGNPEFLTVGARFYRPFTIPCEILLGVHLWRITCWAGLNLYTSLFNPDYWREPSIASFGIGYNFK